MPLFSSCVSSPATVAPLKTVAGERIVLHEGEFDTVYLTGSNLPMRVTMSQTAQNLPLAVGVTTLSPEQFQEMVRRGDVQSPYRH